MVQITDEDHQKALAHQKRVNKFAREDIVTAKSICEQMECSIIANIGKIELAQLVNEVRKIYEIFVDAAEKQEALHDQNKVFRCRMNELSDDLEIELQDFEDLGVGVVMDWYNYSVAEIYLPNVKEVTQEQRQAAQDILERKIHTPGLLSEENEAARRKSVELMTENSRHIANCAMARHLNMKRKRDRARRELARRRAGILIREVLEWHDLIDSVELEHAADVDRRDRIIINTQLKQYISSTLSALEIVHKIVEVEHISIERGVQVANKNHFSSRSSFLAAYVLQAKSTRQAHAAGVTYQSESYYQHRLSQ